MGLKQLLIQAYDKLYNSDIVLGAVYAYRNQDHRLNIMRPEKTVEYILENNCSISRYGDGEFELMLQPDQDLGFQKRDPELAKRLKAVFTNQNDNLLICVPYTLNNIRGRTEHSRKFWFHWGLKNDQHHRTVELIRRYLPDSGFFGDAQITRPYVAYKTQNHAEIMFPKLMKLWEGQDILFVEGEKTRLGVGNDLFDNAKSIKRILCPATNAFDRYGEIVEVVKRVWNGELILLALGPTATVMAAQFADMGMRALDIGHLDIEYEWYLRGAKKHDQIEGKYTNEAEDGYRVIDCEDEKYLEQIVYRVV